MNIKTSPHQSSPLTPGSETIEKDCMECIWKELMSKDEYDQNGLYIRIKFSKICITFFKKIKVEPKHSCALSSGTWKYTVLGLSTSSTTHNHYLAAFK